MFMLGIGELLEEWTHKKSVDDLARTMSLNVSSVWCRAGDEQVLVPVHQIKKGDYIIGPCRKYDSVRRSCKGRRGNGQSGIAHG